MKPCYNVKDLLAHHKNAIKDGSTKSVVYKILCADCPASYTEETKKRLDAQVKEHQSNVKHLNHEVSALAEHARKTTVLTGKKYLDDSRNV